MKFIVRYSLVFISLLLFLQAVGQDTIPDCIHPKTISIPLNENMEQDYLEKIYYQKEDNYTYWYKVSVESSCQLTYYLNPINSEDDYGVLVYKYEGDGFCNDLVYRRVTPFITESKSVLHVKKGDVYYIGVLHISGYGCGHTLFLDSENKRVTIKAIQNECVEDAMETIVEETFVEEKKDTVIGNDLIKVIEEVVIEIDSIEKIVESVVEVDTIDQKLEQPSQPVSEIVKVTGDVINSNTKQRLDTYVFVVDGEREGNLYSRADSGFVFTHSGIGYVIVSIRKFGYELFSDTVRIENNHIKISLTPIKVGDKLIMHKIYFHPNTYALKEESRIELVKLTKFMLENKDYSFEVQGHTNGNKIIRKTKQYEHLGKEWNFSGTSKKLSKLRAEKIKTYLVKNGVKESQLITVGYGGDDMIVEKPKVMKEAMKNIRVEVVVLE